MRYFHILLFIQLFSKNFISTVNAQDYSAFVSEQFISQHDTLNYRILYPLHFKKGKKYPLLVLLHGSGERGSDNAKQLAHGASLFLDSTIRNRHEMIVVFPQCPANESFAAYMKYLDAVDGLHRIQFLPNDSLTRPLKMVSSLIDHLTKTIATKHQIILGGLSMGGMAVYELLEAYPKRFSAAFVMCGAGRSGTHLDWAKKTPIWIFHGAQDDVVLPEYGREMYHDLLLRKADVRYTEYPEANHNCWDRAFAEPELLDWLLRK